MFSFRSKSRVSSEAKTEKGSKLWDLNSESSVFERKLICESKHRRNLLVIADTREISNVEGLKRKKKKKKK